MSEEITFNIDEEKNSIDFTFNNLTEDEQKLLQKYLDEYNDIYQKIFLLSPNALIENIKKKVEISIKSKIKNYSPLTISKIEEYLTNKIYLPDLKFASIIKRNIEKRTKREIALHYFRGEIIPHCKDDKKEDFYVHSCGEKFQFFRYKSSNIHYDYVLYCQKCDMIYKSNLIKFLCNKTNSEFYSKLLNGDNKSNNVCYATWKKYHCNAVINDTMKCPICEEILYYLKDDDILYCKKCDVKKKPLEIIWKCLICHQEFQTEAKIYNPLEYKSLKICVKDAIANKIYARPEYLVCKCNLQLDKAIFFHKEKCRGELYLGEINNEKVVVCGKCDSLGIYEGYRWTCPQCFKRFKTKKREGSVNIKLGLEENLNVNKNHKNITKPLLENDVHSNKSNNSNFDIKISDKRTLLNKSNYRSNHNSTSNNKNNKVKSNNNLPSTRKFITGSMNSSCNSKYLINNNNRKSITNYSGGKAYNKKNEITHNNTNKKRNLANDLLSLSQKISMEDSYECCKSSHFNSYKKPFNSITSSFSKRFKPQTRNSSNKTNYNTNNNDIRVSNKSFNGKQKIFNNLLSEISGKRNTYDNYYNDKIANNTNNNSSSSLINVKKYRTKRGKLNDKNSCGSKKNILIKDENINEKPKNKIIVKTINFAEANAKNKSNNSKKKNIANNININININNNHNINNQNPNNIIVNNLTITNNHNNNKTQEIQKSAKSSKKLPGVKSSSANFRINNINANININNNKLFNSTNFDTEQRISVNQKNFTSNKNIINNNVKKLDNKFSNFCDYKLIKQIGKGSFGQIFMVENENHQLFALKKLIATSLKDIKTLEHEYQILFDVQNCGVKINLVHIYGIETKQLDPTTFVMYVLMELANTDWEKEILYRNKIKKFYSENELLKIISSLITTFAQLQKENISHRDIKPQNILIFKDTETYKLADFGEAKELISKDKPTDRQTLRGTELYMSPILFYALRGRQIIKYVNHNPYKSDLFSFGLCSLFAATLCFDSIYDIRELKNNAAIRFIVQKYLGCRYSNVVINIICSMLDVNEDSRNDFIEMEKEIKNIGY